MHPDECAVCGYLTRLVLLSADYAIVAEELSYIRMRAQGAESRPTKEVVWDPLPDELFSVED